MAAVFLVKEDGCDYTHYTSLSLDWTINQPTNLARASNYNLAASL